jgi:hypothetical protein
MSSQLARSGIDPDQPLSGRKRGLLIVGIVTLILAVWQAIAGQKGPITAVLPVVGFLAELLVIALAGFCALFAAALGVIWVGRRLSVW